MKKKNDFIKQLARLKKEFLKYAEDNSAKVDKNTFEVEMCKYYLQFRIETDSTSDIYQKPIYGGYIHIEE